MAQEYRVARLTVDGVRIPELHGTLRVWRTEHGRLDWEMQLSSTEFVKPPSESGMLEAELGDGRTFSGGFVASAMSVSDARTAIVLKANGDISGLAEWE